MWSRAGFQIQTPAAASIWSRVFECSQFNLPQGLDVKRTRDGWTTRRSEQQHEVLYVKATQHNISHASDIKSGQYGVHA